MSTAALSPIPAPKPQKRFTVAEYHRLMDLGIIRKKDRCELVRGLIVEKPRINPPHATAVTRLSRRLFAVGDGLVVRIQLPVTLADSEPEPDAVLAIGTDADYEAAHPTPRQIVLLVEVSDSSLPDERGEKYVLCAENRVAVYWIVNLIDRRIEVYTNPRGGKNPVYRTKAEYGPADAVPVVVGGKTLGTIPVKDVLP